MPIEVKIPEVGESITEVQIAEWLKNEGDEVKSDENLAVIDSEKTTFELPSPQPGRIVKILHPAGDTVKVGEVIAQIETDGQPAKEKPRASPQPGTKVEPKSQPESTAAGETPAAETPASPADNSLHKQKAEGWDEESTAPNPAQKEPQATSPRESQKGPPDETVPAATSASGADRTEQVVPMTMLRRTIAKRLVQAQQAMAMLTTFNEIDMSAVLGLRKQHGEAFEKRHHVRLGFMSFFLKAAIEALKQFPNLNAEIRGSDIVNRNYFDIGVAIATERGLVVPVLRNAERLSFAEVEKQIGDCATRARDGQLKPEELEGGTFTITNGGLFGSLLSTPIVNPPQSGILGMHTIQDRPVAISGQVAIRPMMYVALTYDHRIVDGREAVLFLRRVKETVENPARLLMEV